MRKPYLLRTPSFDPTSGGIKVMYGLYGHLLARGEIAYLNAVVDDIPSVGIYPEIYGGNDMQATKVVRYVLQTAGMMGTATQDGVFRTGPTTEEIKATSDEIYVFSRIYDTFGVDDDHILFLPIINTKVFKYKKTTRSKTCYLVGKGTDLKKHPKDSIQLTRQFAQDQQALADLLNECHTLYCYDRLSAMMELARLCGCKVKYYGDFSKEKLALYEPGMNGLGYGDEDVQLDTEAFVRHYASLGQDFNRKLGIFIDNTQL